MTLVPILGVEVKGAKRWLDFYLFRLQPVEILKPFFILVSVKILTLEKLQNSHVKYIFSFLLLSSVVILLINQPDLGQSILLTITWIATVLHIWGKFIIYCWFFFNFFISICLLLFLMPENLDMLLID